MQNSLQQIDIKKMVEGEIQVVELPQGQFFAVKKIKNIQNGKVLDYKVGVGKSREEALELLK